MAVILIALGVFNLYNTLTLLLPIPYIDLISTNNLVIDTLTLVSLKWSWLLGILYLTLGVLGIKYKTDKQLAKLIVILGYFAGFFSIFLII